MLEARAVPSATPVALHLLARFELRRRILLRPLEIAAAIEAFLVCLLAHLLALFTNLLALFASLGALFFRRLTVALLLIAMPSPVLLPERGRSRSAGQKNGN